MKISVIIPVYNSSKTLSKCLDSVIKQRYENWEAIVIDDGSTDDSYEIMKYYADKDSRIQCHSHENKGPGLTRNKGIDVSTGEYIVFLDSDDYIEDIYFYYLSEYVSKDNSDVIFIDAIQEDPKGFAIKKELMSMYKNIDKDIIIKYQMTGKLPWGGWRKAIKADIVKKNNIRYTEDTVGEEAIFSFDILYNAKKISFIPEICYHYVNYPQSQSKKGDNDPWGNVCKKMKIHLSSKNILEKYEMVVNSFGYTACIVSILRISMNYSFFKSIKISQNALYNFKKEYGFDIDKECLDKRAALMLPFAKTNMSMFIVIMAKFKVLFKL